MAVVAAQAGVALDMVYASVGRKPALFRLLLETAISGRDEAVPPQDREYVKAILLAGAAGEKIRLYAADLASTGAPRPGLTVDEVADVVWSMSSSEYYLLLVQQRGWAPERFERWLAEAWCRLFLA